MHLELSTKLFGYSEIASQSHHFDRSDILMKRTHERDIYTGCSYPAGMSGVRIILTTQQMRHARRDTHLILSFHLASNSYLITIPQNARQKTHVKKAILQYIVTTYLQQTRSPVRCEGCLAVVSVKKIPLPRARIAKNHQVLATGRSMVRTTGIERRLAFCSSARLGHHKIHEYRINLLFLGALPLPARSTAYRKKWTLRLTTWSTMAGEETVAFDRTSPHSPRGIHGVSPRDQLDPEGDFLRPSTFVL
ncbi:hypothetical protein F5Y16DRAFT_379489 [Xylariaceae sp. FL0255]|nr:hypothetical protein F5Y16DRAFT_379489 [Xylariaceae sp. FL0255]